MTTFAEGHARRWEPFGVTEADFDAAPERDGVAISGSRDFPGFRAVDKAADGTAQGVEMQDAPSNAGIDWAAGVLRSLWAGDQLAGLTGHSCRLRTWPSRASTAAGSTAFHVTSNRPCSGHATDCRCRRVMVLDLTTSRRSG
jgi:hypothetical protein